MGVLAPEIEATYEVLSKMGEGGMGAVYKVRHRFFDEVRVIKVMQTGLEGVAGIQERFLGEAKRGKQLRHPNLAEVIDFSMTPDGTAYMVMEYIDGVNLRDVLARHGGPLDYRTVVPIAEQTLDALGYLHSRKFVHRDVSPDNLMLTRDGDAQRVKLIDLGIAKSLEATRQLTMAGKFIGKAKYASPEQFSGSADARSDLYSLGVVLYELLTGELPVTGKNQIALITNVVTQPPRSFDETDPLGRVPAPIREAVMKALAKNPDERYTSAAEFADALRRGVAPVDVTAQTEIDMTSGAAGSQPAETSRRAKSPPLHLIAAGAAALLVIAVIALLVVRRSQETETPPQVVAPVVSTTTIDVPPPTGQLLINALPWGRITSVRDASGVEHLTGGEAETPLVLSLPAGDYKVRLTNPNSGTSIELDATVNADALTRSVAELDRIDAAAYVDGIGIGR